jgi:very-short-patch-repair endonuclease
VLAKEDYEITYLQQLATAASHLQQLGFGNESPNELTILITNVDKLYDELQSLLTKPESVSNFLKFLLLRELAEQAPNDLILNKHPAHALATTQLLFKHAQQIFSLLRARLAEYEPHFLLRKLPTAAEINELADELRKYQDSWLAWLFTDYWRARQAVKKFSVITANKLNSRELISKLEQLAVIKAKIEQESQREQYRQALGPLFNGVETDWANLAQHIEWARKLCEAFDSREKAQELLATQIDPHSYLLKSTAVLYEQWLRVTKVANQLNVPVDSHGQVSNFVEKLLERRDDVAKTLPILQQLPILSDKHIVSIQGAAQSLLTAWQLRADNAENSLLINLLGKDFHGITTDISELVAITQWLNELQTVGQIPPLWLNWLINDDFILIIQHVEKILDKIRALLTQLDEFLQQLAIFGELDIEKWLTCSVVDCTLATVLNKLTVCYKTINSLGTLATFYFLKQEVDKLGLGLITQALLSQTISPAHAPLHFKYAVYQSLARELMRKYSALATFSRVSHENLRQRFAESDKLLLKKFRHRVARQVAQRPIPNGNCSGKVGTYTEKCLLEHELSKKKRHISIRQLVRRATKALQALKPCFMMSPLSVAQYLPPGQVEFDLLIIDEASQIRPEDALGAIARCQQIVIVGDPKQLPPTPFFERLLHDDEENLLETVLDGQESILDICLGIYRTGRLRWHYRSAHEGLIAFSNQQFYDNELVVFPAPQGKNEVYGVHFHYVANATYLKGRNLKEAEAVVAAVESHFRASPSWSLGIATFNIKQQELISDLLDKRCKENLWLEEQIKATEAGDEPFFIKNLENVQGDERDVILVSVTYGPDAETGRVFQRFGPIANELGWRRLNVIFTRAKRRLEVFSSLHADDILLTPDSKRGVRVLKMYLEYAQTGYLPAYGQATGREAESDFEIAVARILHEHGYETVPQVGVGGFRIDIGVYHPHKPGEYLLGIECDGASYHSAKSVRDRDRLRQEILESKGWKIHRIWSTDWFKNRDAEVERLLQRLAALVGERAVQQ